MLNVSLDVIRFYFFQRYVYFIQYVYSRNNPYYKEIHNKENIPDILGGNYEIVYKYDVQSFLEYYKGIFTPASLQRIACINQKEMQHYSAGHRKLRLAQRKENRIRTS